MMNKVGLMKLRGTIERSMDAVGEKGKDLNKRVKDKGHATL